MSTAFDARPKRSLGQNFLADANVARRIVSSLAIEAGDTVLEIGPGRGALTGFLLESAAGRVLALEKDTELAFELKRRHPELGVCACDAMAQDWGRLDRLGGLRVVGNLPYNVASPIMWDLVAGAVGYKRAVFMVQNEVAERIAAKPRTKAYGALTVWLQSFARVSKLFVVGPSVFRPRPKVDSAVLAFAPLPPEARPKDPKALAGLLRRVFSMRRKQLGSILGKTPGTAWATYLENQGLGLTARPEELSPGQMVELSACFGREG